MKIVGGVSKYVTLIYTKIISGNCACKMCKCIEPYLIENSKKIVKNSKNLVRAMKIFGHVDNFFGYLEI